MAKILSTVAFIFALWAVAAVTGGATAAQSPPANLGECGRLIIFNNLMECMMFLSNEGNEDKPEQSSCSGLQKLVDVNCNCVCFAISGSATIGMDINVTKAEALPAACGVSAPSVATCYDTKLISEAPVLSQHHHVPDPPSPCSGTSTIASIFFVISTVVSSLLLLAWI